MSKGLYSLTFILGAAVGSVVTWYLVKDKYEQLANEEIESVKEVFTRRAEKKMETKTEKKPEGIHVKTKPNIMEYAARLSEEGYTNYAKEEKREVKIEPDELPYIISPDQYDDEMDYDKVSYVYYADGVLADETDEIVEADGVVPTDFADHFGEYENDTVYVRDDELKVDYDICRDDRTYEEVVGHKPPRVEIK